MISGLNFLIRKSIGRFPTRSLLACLFCGLLMVTIALTSFLLIKSGNRIVGDVIAATAKTISTDLSQEVTRLLSTPDVVNINGARSILAGRIDYTDDDSVTRFFMDAPQRGAEYSVSSIYFAEPTGRFIGVEVSDHRHDLDSWGVSIASDDTNGIYTDFEVNSDGTVGAKISELKAYDPRERSWYVSAIATPEHAVWTDVYTDFNTNLATLTRAQAVQDKSGKLVGVLAVDLFLEHIQTFLSTLEMSANSEVFILNSNGLVLAAHSPAYTGSLPSHNILVTDSPFLMLPAAIELIGNLDSIEATEQHTFTRGRGRAATVNLIGEDGYLYSAAIGEEHGVDWTLGVYIPNSDFLQSADKRMVELAPLAIIGLLLIGSALTVFLSVLIRPLEELRVSANRIASGNFETNIDTSMGNEVGELARSIDRMQKNLQASFTELESNCQELSEEKCRAETTLGSIADAVVSINRDHRVVYMNPTAQLLTGWQFDQIKLEDAARIVNVQYRDKQKKLSVEEFEKMLNSSSNTEVEGLELVHKSGVSHPVSFSIAPTIDETGENYGSVIVFSDLTEKIQMTSELVHQATHDDLTGLINRREFERLLEQSLQEQKKNTQTDTLLYLDLDQFKIVNDSCGHVAGDELLRQISVNFEKCVRRGDVVARLGGDEFGVLLNHCSADDGMRIAEKILGSLGKYRFDWEQRSFRVGVSVGLLSIDSNAISVGAVLSDADSACYFAKESGRNRIHQFNKKDDLINARRKEIGWVEKIERAIDLDMFALYAQRIVATSNNPDDRVHFEVLLRIMDDNGEIFPPGAFFPAAERYHLSANIDRWVIKNTFKWLDANRDFVSSMGVCSINMSGQSVGDNNFADYIIGLLDDYKVPANKICFEVTETATIASLSVTRNMIDKLRGRGCLFSLDDFGTGLSSFEYLKNLHVDYLKIDGLFVRDIIDNKYDLAIVNSINEIGKTLGLKTVAEFVENQELLNKLEEIGLDFVQGYGVSLPQPIDELLAIPLEYTA